MTARRACAVAACAATVSVMACGGVLAADVSSSELADLAQRARTDPVALGELRDVDSVDGRPADVDAALGRDPATVGQRLDSLAAAAGSSPEAPAARPRDDAADILAERRFQPSELPRPFAGPLRRLGNALGRAFDRVVGVLPGGEATFWVITSLVIVAIAALIATRAARRRGRVRVARSDDAGVSAERRPLGAKELLAEADRAEANGDGRTAVRLRFRAGLLRLGSRGAIEFRPSITTGEVRRRLRSNEFEAVATSFEEITYGDRPVTVDDLDLSRRGWDVVLERVAA